MKIYSSFITRNGKRIYASQYGLKAFCFEVSEEENKTYQARKNKKGK